MKKKQACRNAFLNSDWLIIDDDVMQPPHPGTIQYEQRLHDVLMTSSTPKTSSKRLQDQTWCTLDNIKKSNSRRNNLPHLCYFITEILYINYSIWSHPVGLNLYFLTKFEATFYLV